MIDDTKQPTPIKSADDDLTGPWFSAEQARRYVPCKTMKGWYCWRNRYGIVTRANGSVAKRDLDRVLDARRKRARKPMAAASLANLQRRRSA